MIVFWTTIWLRRLISSTVLEMGGKSADRLRRVAEMLVGIGFWERGVG